MQTFVMTGATRGIGREPLRSLVATCPDATVVLLARSGSDLSWVRARGGDGITVHHVDIDLDSIATTAAAAERVAAMVADGTIPP